MPEPAVRFTGRAPDLTPSARHLAPVAIATLLVAGCPIAGVWWLRESGSVSSAVVGVILGMALSLAASFIGRKVWEQRPGSEDLLFSELMIWGYLHRRRTQRRLASALDMVGPLSEAQGRALDGLSRTEQAKLLEQLVSDMETCDPYLHGHSRRVARHSWMIAKRMGLPSAEVARIRTAAAIHDVGKVNTPREILHKPGALTDAEYGVIKLHPGDGARMAAILRDPALTAIVRHHHERLDGSGYPDGLAGDRIQIGARIVAVADTFDAITSRRPYRPASAHKRAIDILREESGTRLDPAVVRAFCGHYAGRGPLALWSSLAGLPERVISWLGSSATTVASAAKVVAVAALVGGAAVMTSTLGLHAVKHARRSRHHSTATAARGAPAAYSTSLTAPAPTPAPIRSLPRHSARPHRPAAAPLAHGVAATGAGTGAAESAGPGSGASAGAGAGAGVGVGANDTVGTNAEAGPGKGESPSTGKAEEAPGKSEAPKGKSGEAPGKSEEVPAKGEEAKGKSEEAAAKSEEAHGKGEEAHGKSEEAHGKSEEAHGKSEEAHARSEERKSEDGK